MLAVTSAAPATPIWRFGFVLANVAVAACAVIAWRRGLSITAIVVAGVVARLMLLPLPPTLSDDAWRYLWDGLVSSGGNNPFLLRPTDRALDGIALLLPLGRLNSPDYFSVYPPVSQAGFFLAGLATRVTGSLVVGIGIIKIIATAAEMIALLLLARCIAPTLPRPSVLALYAWNPLVLVEAAGQAHTEALMLPLLVGTLIAAQADRHRLAGVLLAAAAWTKLYPLLLLPLLWRRGGWRSVWPSLLTLILLAVPFASAEVPGNVRESLSLYTAHFEFFAAPYFALKSLFVTELDDGGDTAAMLLRGLLLLGTLATYLVDWRRRWPLDVAFAAVLGLYIFTATTVHPWYLLGLLAMPCVWQTPRWHWLFLGLAASATYLRYANLEPTYIAVIWIGWGGWLLLLPLSWLPFVIQSRSRGKARRVADALRHARPADGSNDTPRSRLLDLGCGEGEVGLALQRYGFDVVFADVADFHAPEAEPFTRYDGRALPFEDKLSKPSCSTLFCITRTTRKQSLPRPCGWAVRSWSSRASTERTSDSRS